MRPLPTRRWPELGREEPWHWQGYELTHPGTAYLILLPEFFLQERERNVIFTLDKHYCLQSRLQMPWGDEDTAPFDLNLLLEEVVRVRPAYVLMAHNHPGCLPDPSPEDHELTQEVAELLQRQGVRLLDHLIVAGIRFCSMRGEGLMPKEAEPAVYPPLRVPSEEDPDNDWFLED